MIKANRLFLICLTIVIAILANAPRVPAQYEYRPYTMPSGMGGVFNNSISATISANEWHRIFMCGTLQTPCSSTESNQAGTSNSRSSSANNSSPAQTPPTKPVDESTLRFRPTGTYIKTRELADQLGSNAAERDQYFKLMNAVLDEFGKKVAAAGLQNDLAIAISYFFAENLCIYRGEAELSDQQFIDTRNLIAQLLVLQGGANKMTDRQKQEMYEALVAYTGITQFGYEQSKQANNEPAVKGFQQIAGQNLKAITKMSPDSFGGAG